MPVDRRLVKTEKAEDPSRYRTIGTLARIAAFPVRIAQACKPSLLDSGGVSRGLRVEVTL